MFWQDHFVLSYNTSPIDCIYLINVQNIDMDLLFCLVPVSKTDISSTFVFKRIFIFVIFVILRGIWHLHKM